MGTFTGKTYIMLKTMVSCRFSLKPIHRIVWYLVLSCFIWELGFRDTRHFQPSTGKPCALKCVFCMCIYIYYVCTYYWVYSTANQTHDVDCRVSKTSHFQEVVMDSEDLSCCVLSINEIKYCDSMVLSIFETYPKCIQMCFLSKPILVGGLEHVIFHNMNG